jgi:hypothetical protein
MFIPIDATKPLFHPIPALPSGLGVGIMEKQNAGVLGVSTGTLQQVAAVVNCTNAVSFACS